MRAIDPVWLQSVTLAIAVLGAVLGVLNAWRNWVNDRVRVRVSVSHALDTFGSHLLMVTVVNLSTFPITVQRMGFDLVGTTDHAALIDPQFTGAHSLPVRLEPRASCAVVQQVGALPPQIGATLCQAYIETACGRTFKGGRRLFREYRRALAAK